MVIDLLTFPILYLTTSQPYPATQLNTRGPKSLAGFIPFPAFIPKPMQIIANITPINGGWADFGILFCSSVIMPMLKQRMKVQLI